MAYSTVWYRTVLYSTVPYCIVLYWHCNYSFKLQVQVEIDLEIGTFCVHMKMTWTRAWQFHLGQFNFFVYDFVSIIYHVSSSWLMKTTIICLFLSKRQIFKVKIEKNYLLLKCWEIIICILPVILIVTPFTQLSCSEILRHKCYSYIIR